MKHASPLIPLIASFAQVQAFPWVADQPGVSSPWSQAYKSAHARRQEPSGLQCPFNANHEPAAPFNPDYPYNYAKNGQKGRETGGYQVPAPGDTAHQFKEPNPDTDIRGPCPGLNAAANHNFLARDGITTFDELVDAQQNIYNVGYDLAMLLATLGLTLTDGDIVTEKLSIGCDATSRTSYSPLLTGSEPGLNGHNKFEADSSLTRDDYFPDQDNYSFNGTLFGMMDDTCNSYFDRSGLSAYRQERYMQSRDNNPNFYFGPLSLLLYGAASFLYELMPNGNHNYEPDLETISSFFGAEQNGDGSFSFNNQEKIPDNWVNRVAPYDNNAVTTEIVAMYLENPVLFGGNTGNGGFNTVNFGAIEQGSIPVGIGATETACLLYQLSTQSVPSYLNSVITPTVQALNFVAKKLAPEFDHLGCPAPLTK